MGYRRGLVAFALLLVLARGASAAQQTPVPVYSDDTYFRAALARMNALPPPPSFTYAAEVKTADGTVDMRRVGTDDVRAIFFAGGEIGSNGNADATYTFSFDNRKRVAYLVGGATMMGPLPGPIFDPTWNSAFRWMQSRRFFDVSLPSATPLPEVAATQLKTIATVSRTPELSYHVVGRSRATCANRDPGWQLSVVPVGDPVNHPLTGVLVDERTGLLCAMQFNEAVSSVPDGDARSAIELQFDRIDGLYVVTAESIAMHLAVPGPIRGMTATIIFRQFAEQ
jgi:hypothetical protein